MKSRRKRSTAKDPFIRACAACGALAGEGCLTFGKDAKRLPLVPIATRLVHAARLEEGAPNA